MTRVLRWTVIAVVTAVLAWWGVMRLASVSHRKEAPTPGEVTDMGRLREIVYLLREAPGGPLVDGQGRVDVYALVTSGVISMERALVLFSSARSNLGPTAEEVLAGDYTRFQYERGRPAEEALPILFDKVAFGARGKIVAYADGEVYRGRE